MEMMKIMKRVLICCLCFVLVCSCAAAESGINLGAEGCDLLKFACTLPDGRMVFCGSRGTVGNYNESRARLLCLNPDWTVSWEYFDDAPGMGRYNWGALLADGTIGVIYTNAPYQDLKAVELRRFSQDGEPAGGTVDLMQEEPDMPDYVSPVGMIQTVVSEEGQSVRGFMDWDGKALFAIQPKQTIRLWDVAAADDGIVLAGSEPDAQGYPKLMRVDLQGNTVWETVLPLACSFTQEGRVQECIRTSDGGYLCYIAETGPIASNGTYRWGYSLVHLNADGRVLWTNRESFAEYELLGCADLLEYDGKYVFLEQNNTDVSEKAPRVFHWFGADGEELGVTELQILREDAKGVTEKDKVEIYGGGRDLFATEDGAWFLCSIRIRDDKDIRKEMDTVDMMVYRVPEL